MKKIGVTGTIASGKTTVSILLRRMGYRVFDCDGYSRMVYRKNDPCFEQIVNAFGTDILGEFGEIDRKKLCACFPGRMYCLDISSVHSKSSFLSMILYFMSAALSLRFLL